MLLIVGGGAQQPRVEEGTKVLQIAFLPVGHNLICACPLTLLMNQAHDAAQIYSILVHFPVANSAKGAVPRLVKRTTCAKSLTVSNEV
jgi:hypothetical protein